MFDSDGLMPVGRSDLTATQTAKGTGQAARSPNWLRSGARARIVISIAVLIIPVFLVLAAGVQIVAGEGQARVAFVLLLMPVVVIWPVAWWVLRDLWGRHR